MQAAGSLELSRPRGFFGGSQLTEKAAAITSRRRKTSVNLHHGWQGQKHLFSMCESLKRV